MADNWVEYCIKVKSNTEMKDITDILNSIEGGFGMKYIGHVSGKDYCSILSDPLSDSIIEKIKKITGVEKIFFE